MTPPIWRVVVPASLVLHAGLGWALSYAPGRVRRSPAVISVEVRRRPPAPLAAPTALPPETPRPPSPAPAAPAAPRAPRALPRPAAAASKAPSPGPVHDFGVSMTGGGGDAMAAAAGAGPAGGATDPPPRTLSEAGEGDCPGGAAKARPIEVPQPVFPDEARAAGIAGKVRVEVRIDESGAVVTARVLQSLSPECDAAALEAARAARFEPASRCGRPVASSAVIGIRFTL